MHSGHFHLKSVRSDPIKCMPPPPPPPHRPPLPPPLLAVPALVVQAPVEVFTWEDILALYEDEVITVEDDKVVTVGLVFF